LIVVLVAAALIISSLVALIIYTNQGSSGENPPSLESSLSSSSSPSGTNDLNSCPAGIQTLTLNGTEFCSIDVANDTVLGGPGFSYFLNGSVEFMGVTFQTICPSNYMGCPGANSSASTVTLGIMRFNMAFPDKTNETASQPIGDSSYVLILSQHTGPRAGMLIEIEYAAHATTGHVFLLVEKP
jgi:hypothetical protein